jgi:hypothetical protein
MKLNSTGIVNWYYKTFYCGKFGHLYAEIIDTDKKRCITCGDEYKFIRPPHRNGIGYTE